MKLFLDTNVLAAAIGTRGLCAELLELVLEDHQIVICAELLDELQRVLAEKFHLPETLAGTYCQFLLEVGDMTCPVMEIDFVSPDPDDTPLLAAALAGRASHFVTGDKALLAMPAIPDLCIVSPRQMWDALTLDNASAS